MALEHNLYRPQYQLDLGDLAGPPEFGWHRLLNDEGGSSLGLHDTNLYDQDEDSAGATIDQATGQSIDNSTYTGLEGLRIVDITARPADEDNGDVLGVIIEYDQREPEAN